MTAVTFFRDGKQITGYEASGHTDYSEAGSDIVCAAVSSALYMAANTLTEIVGARADVIVEDGYLKILLLDKIAQCQPVLRGLALHLNGLMEQYSPFLHIQ
jgi:uncharacterized protein YsxB (DUF464 family)